MKLYVLGNGFDIGHKIPCKYSNFHKYLIEKRSDVLEEMEKYYDVGENSDLWCDFERGLEEYIAYDSLTNIIQENAPNFGSDDFRDGDWYDAQIYIEQDCDELLECIRSGFEKWIESLEISQVNKAYKLDKTAQYITFNYTEVLELVYKIPQSNILHIHNKVGEELIFGHGKELDDFNVKEALYGNESAYLSYDEDGNTEPNEFGHEQFAENAVCVFYEKMKKHTDKIILNHSNFFNNFSKVNEVVVLGHSYNEIDLPYFQKIAKSISKTAKWTLCYFSEDDMQLAKETVEQLNIKQDLQEYINCQELEIENTQLKIF